MSSVPLVAARRLYHIGTLDPAQKGRFMPDSLEGRCLSVSRHPAAWRAIAKLGGNDLHLFEKPDGMLVDVYKALKRRAFIGPITAAAVTAGDIIPKAAWQLWDYDPDIEEWKYHTLEAKDEALAEFEEQAAFDEDLDAIDPLVEGGPRNKPMIQPVDLLVAAPALCERTGFRPNLSLCGPEIALFDWAAREGYDGLWWAERLDPAGLSAPRGGIFPERLSEWATTQTDWRLAPDID